MVLESTLDINLSFLVRDSDFKEWELLYKHDGIIVVWELVASDASDSAADQGCCFFSVVGRT